MNQCRCISNRLVDINRKPMVICLLLIIIIIFFFYGNIHHNQK